MNSELKKEMSILLDSYQQLKEKWIKELINLKDINIQSEENESLYDIFEDRNLTRKIARFQWIVLWRIVYSMNIEEKEWNLLMIDTLNDSKQFKDFFKNDQLTSNKIIEKWLWTFLVKDMILDFKSKWIKTFFLQSIVTSTWFYEKIFSKFKKENLILDFKRLENDNFIFEVSIS